MDSINVVDGKSVWKSALKSAAIGGVIGLWAGAATGVLSDTAQLGDFQ